MIKTAFAAAAAAAAFAAPGAALAGPYVNVETNAGWTGGDYTGATTDFHVATKVLLVSLLPTTFRQVLAWSLQMAALMTLFLLVRQVWVLLLPILSVSTVKSPSSDLATTLLTAAMVSWV